MIPEDDLEPSEFSEASPKQTTKVQEQPLESWVKLLLEPEQRRQLTVLLTVYGKGNLVEVTRGMLKAEAMAIRFFKKGFHKLRDIDVLENLDGLLDQKDYKARLSDYARKALEILVNRGLFEQLATPEPFSDETDPHKVLAFWLLSQTSKSFNLSWDSLERLISNVPDDVDPVHPKLRELELELEKARKQIAKLGGVHSEGQAKAKKVLDQERERTRQEKEARTILDRQYQQARSDLQKANEQLTRTEQELKSQLDPLRSNEEKSRTALENWKRISNEQAQQIHDLEQRKKQNQEAFEQRIATLELQRDSAWSELETQRAEVKQLHRVTKAKPFTEDILERALFIDYPALGVNPLERLIALFEMYDSLVDHTPNDALEQYTNFTDFEHRAPEGILLHGLEHLFDDARQARLGRFLKLSSTRFDAAILALAERKTSERLSPVEMTSTQDGARP